MNNSQFHLFIFFCPFHFLYLFFLNSFVKYIHPIYSVNILLLSLTILVYQRFFNKKLLYKFLIYFNLSLSILILNEILFDLNYINFSLEKKIFHSFFGLENYLNFKMNLNTKLNIFIIQLLTFTFIYKKTNFIAHLLNFILFTNSLIFLILDLFGAAVFFQNSFFIFNRIELINNILFSIIVFLISNIEVKFEKEFLSDEIKQIKENFQIVYEDSPTAIASFDLEYNLISFNRAFFILFQLEPNSNSNFKEFIQEEIKIRILFELENLKKNYMNTFQVEIEFVLKNVQFFWGLANFSFSKNRKEFIFHVQDITKMKKVEEDLQNSKLLLEKKIMDKSVLITNANHEIRSPLNSIINFSNFIIEEAEEKSEQQILSDAKNIKESGYALLNLISEIIEVEKLNIGKAIIFNTKFNLKELSLEVIQKIEMEYLENQNKYNFNFNLNFENILSDKDKIRQILFQLLDNAYKFTDNGKINFSISMIQVSEKDYLFFKIQDTGIGIEENRLTNLFNPYQNREEVKIKKFKGIGLGLTLSKKYIEILNGRIELDSKEGLGTKIEFLIPLNIDNESKFLEK